MRSPGEVRVSVHAPSATPAEQLSPGLAATVTLPVGVPADAVTVKLTVTGCPTSEGSGASEVMVVVVVAGTGAVTVWASVAELPSNWVSPA